MIPIYYFIYGGKRKENVKTNRTGPQQTSKQTHDRSCPARRFLRLPRRPGNARERQQGRGGSARAALAPGTTASKAVLNRYGQKLFCGDHLDRRALGDLVFNNPTERIWLEQLVHPIVRQKIAEELNKSTIII